MPTSEPIPAGAPIWTDLATSDLPAAVDFYTALFGWQYTDFGPEFGHYGQFTKDGARVAGIAPTMAPEQPVSWTVYLHTPDVRDTVERARSAGVHVLAEPMDVADMGAMAVVVDPAGAVVGFWQPGSHTGFELIAEADAPAWHELLTTSYPTSIDFYRDVLGWNIVVRGDTDEFRYSVYQTDDADPYAGIMDAARFLPAGMSSHWSVYFAAADTDKVVNRARALGASVEHGPEDTPYGRLATLVDPQGGRFKVIGVVQPRD